MAQSGTLAVTGARDGAVTLDYRLPGNTFRATSTQPTVAGKYADPCAMISYGIDATTTLHLDTLAVDAFRVAIVDVSRPDSCNTAGDIAKFFATTYHFLGGPDYLALAQDALTQHREVMTGDLNAAVASFARPLRDFASRYATQRQWVRHGDLFVVFAPAYVPNASGTLSGRIDFPKANGFTVAPACDGYAIGGLVQTGPAPVLDPETLRLGVAPTAAVGASSTGGAAVDGGDAFRCAYRLGALPTDVPVAFHARGPARTADRPVVTIVGPEGWTGTETVVAGLPPRNFVALRSSVPVSVGVPTSPENVKASILDGTDPRRAADLNPQPLPPASADALANALLTNGNAAFARGDYAGAAASYGRASTAQPADAIALHNLAIAHAKLGDLARARTELQRAAGLARAAGDARTGGAVARSIIIVGGTIR